jgi:hypothetical protein
MQQRALEMQAILQQFISSGSSAPLGLLEADPRVIRIDVGINTQLTPAATGWNNLAGAAQQRPEVTLNLVDSNSVATGYTFQSDWTFVNASDAQISGTAANYDGSYPTEIANLPASALRDSAYVRDGATLTMTLDNLRADAAYDFLFYGAASNTGETSLFTATGSNSGQDSISPLINNATQVATIDGILANSEGVITILFEGRLLDGSAHSLLVNDDAQGRLNFIQITERLLPMPGDYNDDRMVNAADYTAWRESFGSMSDLDADGNGNGIVDAADYVLWRKAMTAGAASGTTLARSANQLPSVPEPATASVLLLALIMACSWRFAHRRPR